MWGEPQNRVSEGSELRERMPPKGQLVFALSVEDTDENTQCTTARVIGMPLIGTVRPVDNYLAVVKHTVGKS